MIYTVGHSNHPIERFLGLLQRHGIELLADVRSMPYSRYDLRGRDMAYVDPNLTAH